MKGFIKWLEVLNAKDSRVKAVLRRSLSFDPGAYIPAYPYVEPFVKGENDPFRRKMYYLAAGLWASHWKEGRAGQPMPIGRACAAYQLSGGSTSTEQRFISVLDADADQLPHRLRQMISLLKEQTIDFDDLLQKLLFWNDEQKRSQNALAREYYKMTITTLDTEYESTTNEETSK